MGMAEANGQDPRADESQDAQPADYDAPDWSDIRDARVLRALEIVPRAAFVPSHLRHWAMRDAPLPIGCKQTISQPYIVAKMTQALNLSPGESVLEIGTGSGFQTAILCELTALSGRPKGESVYSLERHSSLAEKAKARLQRLGYFPAVLWGDGARGWPEARQFDAIMVTAAPKVLPRPLWQQLREGGRMVIPIGSDADAQVLWLLRKAGERVMGSRLGAVRFVPLISPILDDPAQCVALDG